MELDLPSSPDELVVKEEWAVSAANWIVENVETKVGHIEYDTALRASRLASVWIDEFKAICEAGGEEVQGDPRQAIMKARERALVKSEGIDRYPTGVPTLMTIIASNNAFVLSFAETEQQQVYELLFPSKED